MITPDDASGPVTWAALVASISALGGLVTFWFKRGSAEAEATALAGSAKEISDAALRTAEMAARENQVTSGKLSDFKAEVAQRYATNEALTAAEMRHTQAVEALSGRIENGFKRIDERLDRILGGQPK